MRTAQNPSSFLELKNTEQPLKVTEEDENSWKAGHTSVIPVLARLRQEYLKLQASLDYEVSPFLKNKTTKPSDPLLLRASVTEHAEKHGKCSIFISEISAVSVSALWCSVKPRVLYFMSVTVS